MSEREPMFGRDAELDALVAFLEGGERLCTLVGPGGVGKTRLAEAAARRTNDAWPAGVFFVGLASTRDVLREIARARGLGVKIGRTARAGAALRALVDGLQARGERGAMLLVLDDADPVIDDVAKFARACLEGAAAVRVVVTAREALGIAQERVLTLGPLSIDAAVAMFEARMSEGSEELSEGTQSRGAPAWPEDVRALAERLDRIPLAIELAARRVRVMTPGELLLRLEERFRLLKSDRRDLSERHLTLAGALEWSWELLRPDEQRAFACLGAFSGSFTLEAFEAVVGPEVPSDPIDAAATLLRKSLVTRVDAARVASEARLSMLETLRAFAREKLSQMPSREAIEERHALYYVTRAEHLAARAYGPEAEHALSALEADLSEYLGVFDREITRAPHTSARIGVALADLVLFRDAIDLRSECIALTRRAADQAGDVPLGVRSRVLEAKVALELSHTEEAEKILTEALAIAGAGGDAPLVAEASRSLGWARIAQGRLEEAEGPLLDAQETHRAHRDRRGEADALAAQGILSGLRGNIDGAHAFLSAAHAVHVASGDSIRRLKVADMARLVGLELEAAETPASIDDLRASVGTHRAAGRSWRAALDLLRIAELASISGDAEDARMAFDDARRCAEQAGVPPSLCDIAARAVRLPSKVAGRVNDDRNTPAPDAPVWRVGPDARWLVAPDGARTELSRHGPVRRLLDALVTLHESDKGRALSAMDLLEVGWPGERVRHDAGMLRVYTAVRRLRKLGLESVLVTRDDGYLFDAKVKFLRMGSA